MITNPRHRHDYPDVVGRDSTPDGDADGSPTDGEPRLDGNARRRARTRDALVGAAQAFLAEGTPDPPIQAITDRAGVGFGSFFNHFATKQELFEAAGERSFRTTDDLLAAAVAGIDDPLESMAVQIRLFGRLPEIDPVAARVIAFAPTDTFAMYSGYDLLIERTVEQAKAQGRLPRPDKAVVRNTFAWGAMKHLLLLRVTGSDHPVEWADDFTELALGLFGVDPNTARSLAHAPLPELP